MLIDVKPILHTPGGERTFQFELDLSDMEFAGRYPISRPVIVEGVVRNRAELLSLELTAYTTLDAVCDRCGKKFTQEKATAVFWRRNSRTRTAMRSFFWRTVRWMPVSWPARRSFSEWTQKLCVLKIARGFAPAVVPT